MSKIILTGDRPTGKLHVGHYVGSLKRRVELQNSGEYDKIFIMIADAQALTDNADNPEKVRQNIIEVALDYLSVGLDPAKSDIFIQSQISQLRRSSIILSRAIFVRIASTASFTALTGITSLYINTIKAAAVIIIVYTATSVTA